VLLVHGCHPQVRTRIPLNASLYQKLPQSRTK
jgi:hypothetical protein